jgi:chromosome segregation ATPase
MNYNAMRKPLLQSALVLLAVLIIIGFVAGSGAEGFFGGIASIVKGVLYTVLFAFALAISLVISVALLIAVFLGAIAIYSPDKARDMFNGLQQRIGDFTSLWMSSRGKVSSPDSSTAVSAQAQEAQQSHATSISLQNISEELFAELTLIKNNLDSLYDKNSSTDQALAEMDKTVSKLSDSTMNERLDQVEAQQDEIQTKLDKLLQQLDTLSATTKSREERTQKQEKTLTAAQSDIQSLNNGLEELRNNLIQLKQSLAPEESAVSEKEEHRIFSYLEKETDKKQFAKLIEEAVQKNMTYAEIDEFLSKSLPKKVDETIKEHPTLTKEYIRDQKNS